MKVVNARAALHWLVAMSITIQLWLGWWMLGVPKQPPGARAGWFNLHKSIGITIAAVVVGWIIWRWINRTSGESTSSMRQLPRWQQRAAHANHWLLFALMIVTPLSGLLGSFSTRYPVLYFGFPLPGWNHDWPLAKQVFSTLHVTSVWLLMLVVAVHAAAGLWHWWRRHGVAGAVGLPLRKHPA